MDFALQCLYGIVEGQSQLLPLPLCEQIVAANRTADSHRLSAVPMVVVGMADNSYLNEIVVVIRQPPETGLDSRLDELQAAILGVKLKHLDRFPACVPSESPKRSPFTVDRCSRRAAKALETG